MAGNSSELEALKKRGEASQAALRQKKAQDEAAKKEADAQSRSESWVRAAKAETVYDDRLLDALAAKLTGQSPMQAHRQRPMYKDVIPPMLLTGLLLAIAPLLMPLAYALLLLLASYPVLFFWSYRKAQDRRQQSLRRYRDIAREALKPVQEWAGEQSLHLQNLADLVYISDRLSWYRLILNFQEGKKPDSKEVAAVLTGLLSDIEPVDLSCSLHSGPPEMRVDLEHPQHDSVQPERMKQQLRILVERGLPLLHEKWPLLSVRFGTLKSSVHR